MKLKNLFKKEEKNNEVENHTQYDFAVQQQEERNYWKKFADLMVSKYRDPFLNNPHFRNEFKVIKEFINPGKGERWLDLGCGALPVAELILEKSNREAEIWAGDIYLFPAEKRLKELGNPLIKLKYLNLTKKLPFADNYFDGIVASKVLTYITEFEGVRGKESLRRIFQEIFRILKPGGVLVWSGTKKEVSRLIGALFALGYILNPYQWIKQKCFLPLFAIKMFKFLKPIEEKERKGIYFCVDLKEHEALLISIGFENPMWKMCFGKQILVNKVNKPL